MKGYHVIAINFITLAVAFTILKLTGNIKGSWLALLSPVWGLMVVAFIAGFLGVPLDFGK